MNSISKPICDWLMLLKTVPICLMVALVSISQTTYADPNVLSVQPFRSAETVVYDQGPLITLAGLSAFTPVRQLKVRVVTGTVPQSYIKDRAFQQKQLDEGARELEEYLRKIVPQADITVVRSFSKEATTQPYDVELLVGNPTGSLPAELYGQDLESFLIKFVPTEGNAPHSLHLVGASPAATRYAVWYFLMNYGGVRILGPQTNDNLHETYPVSADGRFYIPEDLLVIHPGPDFKLRVWTPNNIMISHERSDGSYAEPKWQGVEPAAWLAHTVDNKSLEAVGSQRALFDHNLWRIYSPYTLNLMSVSSTAEITDEGHSELIVARIGNSLHIRIFSIEGEKIVDKAEHELIPGETLTVLKQLLNPMPFVTNLSSFEQRKIILMAASVSKHNPPKSNWQPTFSDPQAVNTAHGYAGQFFHDYPQVESVSLSVNDGRIYSPVDLEAYRSVGFGGEISLSNLYYDYVNGVAEQLSQSHPDKSIAFFPYGKVSDPPTGDFKLRDNVIFFAFNEPKLDLQRWESVLPPPGKRRLGIRQWLYGNYSVLPNHYPNALQDMLSWAKRQGFVYYKAEAYATWIFDGPKLWVLANLLWNVEANVDALLDDYFAAAYGSAGPDIRKFFDYAETIYERRPKGANEYRFTAGYEHAAEVYLDNLSRSAGDLDLMSALLDDAKDSLASTSCEYCRLRLERLRTSFDIARWYGEAWLTMRELAVADVQSEADADHVLNLAQDHIIAKTEPERIWNERGNDEFLGADGVRFGITTNHVFVGH